MNKEHDAVKRSVELSSSKWVATSWEVDGPLYQATMALHVCSTEEWMRELRITMLRQLVVLAHARRQCSLGATSLKSKVQLEFSCYRWVLLFFAMIDGLFTRVFRVSLARLLLRNFPLADRNSAEESKVSKDFAT